MSKIITLLIATFIVTTLLDTTIINATTTNFSNQYNNDGDEDKNCNLTPQFNYSTTGLTVHFSDKSIGNYEKILWDFGDGNTSKEIHPVHTYIESGTYNFKQTIISEEGCSKTFSGKVYIK